jgi:integrase/recombinase XerD
VASLIPIIAGPVQAPDQADNDAQLIELWLHGRSVHTQAAYRTDVNRFFQFVGKPLPQVILRDLQMFVDSLTGAVSSRRRAISSLKSLFSFALRVGYLRFSVATAIRTPTPMDTLAERILPEAKIQAMIALTPAGRNNMLLRLLYASGGRVTEICALKWRHLQANRDSGQVTIFGKGAKTHAVLLCTGLWQDLTAFRGEAADDVPVFVSRKHRGHLDPSQVLRIVRAAARRAGIECNVSPHWFRHAHASHAMDHGAGIHLVCATLAHSSIAVTGRYLHAKPHESSAKYLAV